MKAREVIQNLLIKIPYVARWVGKNKVLPDTKALLERIKKGVAVVLRAQEGRSIRKSRLHREAKLARRIRNMGHEVKRSSIGTIYDRSFFSDFEWKQITDGDPTAAYFIFEGKEDSKNETYRCSKTGRAVDCV